MAAKKPKPAVIQQVEPDWRVRDGFAPTRSFKVGEFVEYGNHNKCCIDEDLGDGVYAVTVWGFDNNYGRPVPYEKQQQVNWYNLFPIVPSTAPTFTKKETFFMDQQCRDVNGLLSLVLSAYAGVDFTPDYQRDYVWSLEDKVKLIDSIFNNINIGLFVFARVPFTVDGKGYEIIDGKQRLTALVEFYEDRFQYNGYYFSQLSLQDRNHFEAYGVSIGIMKEPTEKEKYAAFLVVNTFGRVMDEKHLKAVREKYEAMQ